MQQEVDEFAACNFNIRSKCVVFVLENIPEVVELRSLVDYSVRENCWRPRFGDRVISVSFCGPERFQRLPNGRFFVEMELPHSYENGFFELSASGEGDSEKAAQRDVVLKILKMLLTIAPERFN